MRTWMIGLSALALGGCTSVVSESGQAVPDPAAVPPVECESGRAEAYVGQNGTTVAEAARSAAGAKSVRVIALGQAVTQDFRTDRLNVETDAAGIVVKLLCG